MTLASDWIPCSGSGKPGALDSWDLTTDTVRCGICGRRVPRVGSGKVAEHAPLKPWPGQWVRRVHE